MIRNREDLLGQLNEQIKFLNSSCTSFDNGFQGEGKRLAVSIRTLVYDTSQSKSLLQQLNLKNIGFYDTARDWFPENIATHHGLIMIKVKGNENSYVPRLDLIPPGIAKWVKFNSWWQKIIIVDNKRNQFTRKHIVLIVCNKDGGAHVDPKLDDKYANLSRENTLGWKNIRNGLPPVGKIELINVRQIAYEIIKTLENAKILGVDI